MHKSILVCFYAPQYIVGVFDGRRQLELLSIKNAIEQELGVAKAEVKQKNSMIERLHDEVWSISLSINHYIM